MAFEAGTIRGKLDLDTTSFEHGMSESHTHAETEGGKIREIFESLAAVMSEALGPAVGQFAQSLQEAFAGFSEGPVIGVLNAIGVAAGLVREAVEGAGGTFHEMGLAAERAGVEVEWMSRLAAVAGTVGVNLDQLGTGFKTLEQRAGEALEGDKSGVDAFRRLGISMEEVAALKDKPQELFTAIQLALQKIPDQADRVTAALGVMGRQGANLAPLLGMSKEAFEKMADQMKRLGGTVDESDVKLGESLGRIEGYFRAAWLGIERAVSKPVLAFLEQHMAEIEPRLEALAGSIVRGIGRAWTFLADLTRQLAPLLQEVASVAGGALSSAFDALASAAASVWPSIRDTAAVVGDALAPVFRELVPLIDAAWRALVDFSRVDFSILLDVLKALAPVIKGVAEIIEPIIKGLIWLLDRLDDALESAASALGMDPNTNAGLGDVENDLGGKGEPGPDFGDKPDLGGGSSGGWDDDGPATPARPKIDPTERSLTPDRLLVPAPAAPPVTPGSIGDAVAKAAEAARAARGHGGRGEGAGPAPIRRAAEAQQGAADGGGNLLKTFNEMNTFLASTMTQTFRGLNDVSVTLTQTFRDMTSTLQSFRPGGVGSTGDQRPQGSSPITANVTVQSNFDTRDTAHQIAVKLQPAMRKIQRDVQDRAASTALVSTVAAGMGGIG